MPLYTSYILKQFFFLLHIVDIGDKVKGHVELEQVRKIKFILFFNAITYGDDITSIIIG